jgi:hypothetical protein
MKTKLENCMLEALCVVPVYLEALGTFFFVYNTLTYQTKKKKKRYYKDLPSLSLSLSKHYAKT